MNRKILAIFVFCVVIASISAVSAFELNDLFGGSNETVTVGGIDFNVPEGFKEDTTLSVENESYSNPFISFNMSSKTLLKGSGDKIEIGVSESNITATDEMAKDASEGGNNTTINGVNGYNFLDDNLYGFTYAKDGKLVILTVTDEELLNETIIA